MYEKYNIKKRYVIDKAHFKLKRKYVLIYTKAFENLYELDNFLGNNKSPQLAQKEENHERPIIIEETE